MKKILNIILFTSTISFLYSIDLPLNYAPVDHLETRKAIITLDTNKDLCAQLKVAGLWQEDQPLRLHLGCGENHFAGYINIDYPPANHTVQATAGADIYANIRELKLPQNSIDEIRSHHFFEHFDRQMALALLCSWHHALKVGGVLTIETPDFKRSMQLMQSPEYSYEQKQYVLRHIFGSHEAFWAYHYDGWYQEKFVHILKKLLFNEIAINTTQYLLLANIIVSAKKESIQDYSFLAAQAKNILRDSMVNTTTSEEKLWNVWCSAFDEALNNLRAA